MRSFVQITTGRRYPERGFASRFDFKVGQDAPTHCFICDGKGLRKCKKNEFREEEIPELALEPRARGPAHDEWCEQYKAYAEKYGEHCAINFLHCANIVKYQHSARILRPDPNRPTAAEEAQFEKTFGASVWSCQDALMSVFNRWGLDVFRLEALLMNRHGYAPQQDVSISDYIESKFGLPAVFLIRRLLGQLPADNGFPGIPMKKRKKQASADDGKNVQEG